MHCAPVETCLESRSEGYLPRFCKSQQSEVLPSGGGEGAYHAEERELLNP